MITNKNVISKRHIHIFSVGYYVAPTQYRLQGDFPAILVEGNLRCPSMHYFRHEQPIFIYSYTCSNKK
jgi:hypothetical protein